MAAAPPANGLIGMPTRMSSHATRFGLDLGRRHRQPGRQSTPVVVNLISALGQLKARYGADFVLTLAPETFFVQLGYQFYGPGPNNAQALDCLTKNTNCGGYAVHGRHPDLRGLMTWS